MNSVSVRTVARRFAMVPETFTFSDRMSSSGIRIVALIFASKSDHRAFGGGVVWPILKVSEIGEMLHMSESLVKKAVADLRSKAFLKVVKTKQGNRYEIITPKFSGDTFRCKPHISRTATTLVSMSAITSDISDRAFHLLLMLEATGKSHKVVKIPQSKLITYFPSARSGEGYISTRQLNTWLRELENVGLLTRQRNGLMSQNEYVLHKESIVINGVDVIEKDVTPVLATPGTEHTEEEETEDFMNAPRGAVDFSGLSMAKLFYRKVKGLRKVGSWDEALSREDAVNIPALARKFDGWMSDGTPIYMIARMIDIYPSFSDFRLTDPPQHVRERLEKTPVWVDFYSLRALLLDKVTETKRTEDYWSALDDMAEAADSVMVGIAA